MSETMRYSITKKSTKNVQENKRKESGNEVRMNGDEKYEFQTQRSSWPYNEDLDEDSKQDSKRVV